MWQGTTANLITIVGMKPGGRTMLGNKGSWPMSFIGVYKESFRIFRTKYPYLKRTNDVDDDEGS